MKNIDKKIAHALPYFFFLLAVILVLNVVIALGNKETPAFFGYSVMHIKSGSMEPTILTGDIILVRRTDADALVAGDVITFEMVVESGGASVLTTVTHRIVTATGAGEDRVFTTKGDHNNADDTWVVPADAVIGRYVGRSTFFGSVYQLVISAGSGMIYLAAIVLFLIIGVSEGISIMKTFAEQSKKQLEEAKAKLLAEAKAELLAETAKTTDDHPETRTN